MKEREYSSCWPNPHLYWMVTGWTGQPGLKPPVPNLARAVPLVVVPSAKMKTCGQGSGDSARSVISVEACRRLS